MLSYAIEYQKIAVDEENFFIILFFFSNFTRCSISKGNFTEFSFIDLRLFPLSHRRFTVLISHRIPENYIRREQTVAFFSSKRILLNFSLKFRFDLQIRSCNCRPSTNIVENVFSLSLSPPPSFTRREVSTRNVTALPVARRFRINCNVNEPSWALVNGPIRAPFLHCFADPRLRSLVN